MGNARSVRLGRSPRRGRLLARPAGPGGTGKGPWRLVGAALTPRPLPSTPLWRRRALRASLCADSGSAGTRARWFPGCMRVEVVRPCQCSGRICLSGPIASGRVCRLFTSATATAFRVLIRDVRWVSRRRRARATRTRTAGSSAGMKPSQRIILSGGRVVRGSARLGTWRLRNRSGRWARAGWNTFATSRKICRGVSGSNYLNRATCEFSLANAGNVSEGE